MEWNNKICEEIDEGQVLEFQATSGWVDKLGNKYIDRLVKEVLNKKVFIFGAGINGKYAYSVLKRNQVEVCGFFDNNKSLWGKEIQPGIICYNPHNIKSGTAIIGGIRDALVEEIKDEVCMLGGEYYGTITY